eukprot:14458372-Ditylum_brightwellii.AAC.1
MDYDDMNLTNSRGPYDKVTPSLLVDVIGSVSSTHEESIVLIIPPWSKRVPPSTGNVRRSASKTKAVYAAPRGFVWPTTSIKIF